ncbi:LAFE_0C03026g1_1 [Lachancea fermentati]|uniref:GTPase-activating protein GYP5 n=1 Tax=Lachancea fermentati TaxID=4955 RepID=A0A1G4M9K6_LACFM|nr:LAFE_0C03026g1_1 [Lachancea fermentati]
MAEDKSESDVNTKIGTIVSPEEDVHTDFTENVEKIIPSTPEGTKEENTQNLAIPEEIEPEQEAEPIKEAGVENEKTSSADVNITEKCSTTEGEKTAAADENKTAPEGVKSTKQRAQIAGSIELKDEEIGLSTEVHNEILTSKEKESRPTEKSEEQAEVDPSAHEPSIDDLCTSLQSEESKLAKQIEHLNSKTNSPPLPPRDHIQSELPSREIPELPPRDHPELPPRQKTPPMSRESDSDGEAERKQVHAVPPPLSEELQSETFRKNLALSHAGSSPPVLPPRSHQRSESADFDLIINRFHDNEEDYLSKNETTKEDIQEGARILKSSYSAILKEISASEKQDTSEEEQKELGKIDWPFWTKVVNNYADVAKNDSMKMEKEVAAGVPPQIRDIIWQLMANSKSKEIDDLYTALFDKHSEHEKSINRDLLRTKFIPDDKITSLFNVIKAYSLYDPEVGYIQGMAFITTPLLLNVETESEAFGLLISLMKNYGLRDLFLPEMPGLHLKLYQFDRLLEENSPRLFNHLARQGIRSSMYASQWFLTFFAYKFPLGFVLRIFDIVFAEGIESILKFGVILMLKNEDILLQLQFDQLLDFLKNGLFAYYLKENVKKRQENISNQDESSSTLSFVHKISSHNNQREHESEVRDEDYAIDTFVNDAINEVKITPITLKRYVAEYQEIHEIDLQKEAQFESLRIKNKQLHNEVRKLEHDFTLLNREHINIANELIANRLRIETLQDENNDLREEVVQLKNQLREEIRKQSLPNPDSELPTDIRTDLENTMARNLEVMNQNQELQEKITHLEKEIEILKGTKNPLERVASPLKTSNWGGLKKVWK